MSENEIDLEKIRKYREDDYNYYDHSVKDDLEKEWKKYMFQLNPHRQEMFDKINQGFKLIEEGMKMASQEEDLRFSNFWRSGAIQKYCPEFADRMDYGWNSSSFDCM